MTLKDTFTTTKINSVNKVYISKRVLDKLNLKTGDELSVLADPIEREILLRPKKED